MNAEEQRVAIAEACGFTVTTSHEFYKGRFDMEMFQHSPMALVSGKLQELPDYLHDLNAMHDAEKLLNDEQYSLFRKYLCDLHGNGFRVWSATAAKRSEAFLRAIGKWVEE